MDIAHVKYQDLKCLRLFDGMECRVLLDGKHTNGNQAIFEDVVDPGKGPNRHIHHSQDEIFIFVKGVFKVEIERKIYTIKAGDTAIIPRGKVHGWKNIGKEKGILRYMLSPALNIENMFIEIDQANSQFGFNNNQIERLAKKYPDQEITGPPL
jgi:quercetin dioxygenase-like cupin family protein